MTNLGLQASAEELAPFVAPALEALETHNLSIEFITTCCHLLASMSGHPELVALIAEAGGVTILMEVWHLNPDNAAAYGNFDIILDQISRTSQRHTTSNAPCATRCCVPILTGCRSVFGIQWGGRFGTSGSVGSSTPSADR